MNKDGSYLYNLEKNKDENTLSMIFCKDQD